MKSKVSQAQKKPNNVSSVHYNVQGNGAVCRDKREDFENNVNYALVTVSP